MRLFLVGATGQAGRWILKEALDRRHQVTALVRGSADRIQLSHPLLQVREGDLFSFEDLPGIISGHDAVLSSLNSESVEFGTSKLIEASQVAGVNRLIGIAAGGILQLDDKRLRRDRPDYPKRFLMTSEGHLRAWKQLQISNMNWTLICTPDLLQGPASGVIQFCEDYMPQGGQAVSVGDVANFILDEIHACRFLCRRVGLSS